MTKEKIEELEEEIKLNELEEKVRMLKDYNYETEILVKKERKMMETLAPFLKAIAKKP